MKTSTKILAALLVASIISTWVFGAVITILLVGALITLHEFGHWIAARLSSINVPIFSVGFGPREKARVLGNWMGTSFQLRPFPLGGFIAPDEESYNRADFAKRAFVMAAGPAMNLLIPVVLFFFLFLFHGIPETKVRDIFIQNVTVSGPAELGGLKTGDIVLGVGNTTTTKPNDFIEALKGHGGSSLTVHIKRNGAEETVSVTPDKNDRIGIGLGVHVQETARSVGVFSAAGAALSRTSSMVMSNLSIYRTLFLGENLGQLSSIVGIVAEGSKEVNRGLVGAVEYTAVISVALALLNLVPLPGLDGGQLLLLAIEYKRGRKLSPVLQGKLTAVVIVFFLLLFLYALHNDYVWMLGSFWATPAFVITLGLIFIMARPYILKGFAVYSAGRKKAGVTLETAEKTVQIEPVQRDSTTGSDD